MEHYAGIDVSLEQISVCVVDGTGRTSEKPGVESSPRRWFGSSASSAWW